MKCEDWRCENEWEFLGLSYEVSARMADELVETTKKVVDDSPLGEYADDWMYDRVAELAIGHLNKAVESDKVAAVIRTVALEVAEKDVSRPNV